jgi:cytochrome b6-f complex iron-sulfur subunit
MEIGKRFRSERRVLLNAILGTSVGTTILAILYPVVRFLVPPRVAESAQRSVTAGTVGELKANEGKVFRFGSKPGLLVRTADGELKAFAATCTHLDCTVQYRPDMRHIWCACHNGHYDLNGGNLSGPPPAPLEQYDVNVRGDEVVVSKR